MAGTYARQPTQDAIYIAASERNSELARTIAQMYIASVPVLIQVMRNAVAQGNLRDLFRAAEALRASSANLGALRLAALCQKIRDLPSKEQLSNVPSQINEIAQIADKVCGVIQRNQSIVVAHEFA